MQSQYRIAVFYCSIISNIVVTLRYTILNTIVHNCSSKYSNTVVIYNHSNI